MAVVASGWFRAGCVDLPSSVSDFGASTCACDNPPRDVWVSGFEIDRLEATVRDYAACVAAGKCTPTTSYYYQARVSDNTAVVVDYEQAVAYCAWQDKRLPTEAEWEKAARGADGRMYPWGNADPDCMTAAINGDLLGGLDRVVQSDGPHPEPLDCTPPFPGRVGLHPGDRSPYDVLDMAGNVPEWTSDLALDERATVSSECPSLDKSASVKFIDSNTVDPIGPNAESRERWLQSTWPDKKTTRDTYPIHVARSGAIGVRRILPVPGDLGSGYHAGMRCVRPMPGERNPPEPAAAGSYEITIRRGQGGGFAVDSKPADQG
ncbi:MAG: formylglycine-generating enzyme family protein [Kofleriaceae bacterium]|nr:formylglycine-generating enzyme family protein [Kofleriaceae bacterium]